MNLNRCDGCIYWVKKPDKLQIHDDGQVGWCNFFPPTVIAPSPTSSPVSRFPTTWDRNWCGQFHSIDDEVEEIKNRYQTKGVNRDNG